MSQYTDFEAKNVEQALEKAGKELNLAVEALQYDVVSYGSSGIFGLVGVRKAKIRVKTETLQAAVQIQQEARSKAQDLVQDAFEGEEEQTAPPANLEQAISEGCIALRRIVDHISEGASVQAEQQNGRVIFKVDGGNSALLIGKRGQTLEAIQYLLEKMINKQHDARLRILVDVEGYLSARKANLQKLAGKMAEKAQKINKPVTIGQMNAYDRRIVHLFLKDNLAVRTQSVGEGYYRKLIIFPKRRHQGKNKNSAAEALKS